MSVVMRSDSPTHPIDRPIDVTPVCLPAYRPPTHRVLACANAADAVEVLAVGFFLTVYRTNSGAELTSVEKGQWPVGASAGFCRGRLVQSVD